MVYTDPIADMLSRIRNALLVDKFTVEMPYSKLKLTVAKELKKHNFIDAVSVDESSAFKKIIVTICEPGSTPRISTIEKVSKPGRRVYAKADEIPTIKNGRGVVIVSTSKGVMSGNEAKQSRVGGELICKVY